MIKEGVVVLGKTPSVESGRPSDMIKDGEAVRADDPPEVVVLASKAGSSHVAADQPTSDE